MIIELDDRSPVPPFEQIRTQIATMIATGVLDDGHRLPSIRQLASDLELSTSTVARAYRELERDGWVATRGRRGTIVQTDQHGSTVNNVHDELATAARRYAVSAAQLGAPTRLALQAAKDALNDVTTPA